MAPHNPHMVAALRRERAGYLSRGLTDRVEQCDEQLRYYGEEPDDTAPPVGRTAVDSEQHTATVVDPTGPPPVLEIRSEHGPEVVAIELAPAAAEDPAAAKDPAASQSEPTAATPPAETKKGRGRPTLPRDAEGKIIRK